jgi:hypothetical protein
MLHDDAAKVVKYILAELANGFRHRPYEFSLKDIERATGVRPQNIGMAFSPHIEGPLRNRGFVAQKCGTPGRIKIVVDQAPPQTVV